MAKGENEYSFRALNRRAIQRLLNLTAIDQGKIHKLVNESGVIWPEISPPDVTIRILTASTIELIVC